MNFFLEGYADALTIASKETSGYCGCVKALSQGDMAEAERQSDEFYLQLLTEGAGSGPAIRWQQAWAAAVQDAMGEGD